MNKAYIDSLEVRGEKMAEEEWREWIEGEIEDIEKQTGTDPHIDVDEVIRELDLDGFISDPIVGTVFFDGSNARYITPDGVGVNPKEFSCVVEEMDENGDFYIAGRQFFTKNELSHFEKVREV